MVVILLRLFKAIMYGVFNSRETPQAEDCTLVVTLTVVGYRGHALYSRSIWRVYVTSCLKRENICCTGVAFTTRAVAESKYDDWRVKGRHVQA